VVPLPCIKDVHLFEGNGPWATKSGGHLKRLFQMSLSEAKDDFFHYEDGEQGPDIRGFRVYVIEGLPENGIGGMEFHKIRKELVFVLHGSVRWICEDLFGGRQEWILDGKTGLYMPPYILHTYYVQQAGTVLLAVANTLFTADNPATHDTYSLELFRKRQGELLP